MTSKLYLIAWLVLLAPLSQADWPADGRTAVSLAYDDALASQLDNAVPSLNRYHFKASFYLVMSSPVLASRMAQWRLLAQQGHELGNHTLFHPCRASLPNRQWVSTENNLDHLSVAQMVADIETANTFLHALDGKKQRTFTPPCMDKLAKGVEYWTSIKDKFISIKGDDSRFDQKTSWFMPNNISGDRLINQLTESTAPGRFISFTFHGVGGDYLAVTTEAHDQLLDYLAKHSETYYVDSYINIVEKLVH